MSEQKQSKGLSTWVIVFVALVLGIGLGIGASRARVSQVPVDLRHFNDRTGKAPLDDQDESEGAIEKYPKVEVFPSDSYNFGTMARDSKQQHTFVIRNVGRAPLTLEYVDSTCKCTVGALDKTEIAPFESANVTLEWQAADYKLDFRESARIRTNDHRNETLTLSVYGKVQQIIRPVPHDLVITDMSQQASTTASVSIYAYRDDNFEVIDPRFINAGQEYFDLEVRRLTEEQVAEEPNAKSGVQLLLTSRVGVPAGPVQEMLRMETNLPDVQILEIPVTGVVVSDISVVPGRYRFNKQRQRFMFDPISGKEGAEIEVYLLVKGEHRADIQLTPAKADPDFMEISIGEKRKVGKAYMYPLRIKIPPNTKPINRKGSKQGALAEFTIKTSHPKVEEMRFEVELYVF